VFLNDKEQSIVHFHWEFIFSKYFVHDEKEIESELIKPTVLCNGQIINRTIFHVWDFVLSIQMKQINLLNSF
jgi:hypothetical protein